MKQKQMHLYRGASCVRSWSKYQETDKRWTLCGISDKKRDWISTEDETLVTCWACRDLAELPAVSVMQAQSEQAA